MMGMEVNLIVKQIKSLLYTKGHFGKGFRETVDTDNENLYSHGRFPTKIKKEDLSEYYKEFKSRAIWYMTGYLKTSGVKDVYYIYVKENHLFKDDYLYISYNDKLKIEKTEYGTEKCENYDICVCGSDIIPILFEIEKNSQIDTTMARNKIIEKFEWWKKNEEDDYKSWFKDEEVDDILEYYKIRNGR